MFNLDPTAIKNGLGEFRPYKRLAQAIILQAIKDYTKEPHWLSVRLWVKRRHGIFDLCAASWNRNPEELQKIMIKKMDAIDQGEPLKLEDDVDTGKALVLAGMAKK